MTTAVEPHRYTSVNTPPFGTSFLPGPTEVLHAALAAMTQPMIEPLGEVMSA